MLTFSKLGRKGNLGNQFFQIASTVGLAEKLGHEYFFPKWKYSEFLQSPLPIGDKDASYEVLREKEFNYYDWQISGGNFDLEGWLQSEKYFDIEKTRRLFAFKESIQQPLLLKNKTLFDKPTILISVRRGDFVRHPNYFQLSYKYYFLALKEHFSDHGNSNIIFTSDNIEYCKIHFSSLPNSFFLEDFGPMEQLMMAENCDHFIISNSTFSWWAAWLGEKPHSKIIRPMANFRGKFALENSDQDYYPERWIKFDHRGKTVGSKNLSLMVEGEVGEVKDTIYRFARRRYIKLKNSIKKIFVKAQT